MSIDAYSKQKDSTTAPGVARARADEFAGPAAPPTRTDMLGGSLEWMAIPLLQLNVKSIERAGVVTVTCRDDRHMPLDLLRTRLMKTMRQNGWTTVGITSPTARCGKTLIAANLAFSLARLPDFRLGLLDLNLRSPGIDRLLGCKQAYAIEHFLNGQRSMARCLVRHGMNLAIGLNSEPVRNAAELLLDLVPGTAIPAMREALGLDLVILDLPPMLGTDEVLSVLPGVDCVLLVAAADQTTIGEIDVCERDLSDQEKFAGLVLNKCRFTPEKYGY